MGDLNHDGQVDATPVKTEFKPRYGMTENLKGYVTKSRAHRYAECSNAGKCNRNSGECECFDGYEGSACQRRQCPSKVNGATCSGHGICMISTAYAKEQGSTYYGWELDKFLMCKCDDGYEGVDCSLRQCPFGFDPVLYSGITMKYVIDKENSKSLESDFYFQINYDGRTYNTPVIFALDAKNMCPNGYKDSSEIAMYQEEIKTAIQSIPPLSQSRVSITCAPTSDSDNTGIVKQIEIIVEATDPRLFIASTLNANSASSTGLTFTAVNGKIFDNAATEIQALNSYVPTLCSSRGLCDPTSGLCNCFEGYSGYTCESKSTFQS